MGFIGMSYKSMVWNIVKVVVIELKRIILHPLTIKPILIENYQLWGTTGSDSVKRINCLFFFLNGNCGNVLQEHDMEYYKRGSHRDQMNEIETIDRQNDAGRKLAIVGHDRLSCI